MKIIVDYREPKEIMDLLAKCGEVKVETLEVGDYYFPEAGVAFERKSSDFLNISDVFRKVDELRATYPHPYLIVEGSLGGYISMINKMGRKMTKEQILGAVASLAVRGVPPIFVGGNKYFLVRVMVRIAEKFMDGKDRTPMVKPIRPKPTTDDVDLNLFLALPGIGEIHARELKKRFGSFMKFAVANPKEWTEVKGIGKGRMKTIAKALGKEVSE